MRSCPSLECDLNTLCNAECVAWCLQRAVADCMVCVQWMTAFGARISLSLRSAAAKQTALIMMALSCGLCVPPKRYRSDNNSCSEMKGESQGMWLQKGSTKPSSYLKAVIITHGPLAV